MEKLVINGGTPLKGEVTISGAKNSAVAILPATLLIDGVCTINNLPNIVDVKLSCEILEGLGGVSNIQNLDCCATRLRVKVHNSNEVNDTLLKETGAAGVIKKDDGIQVIYGPRVSVIKSDLEEYIESLVPASTVKE